MRSWEWLRNILGSCSLSSVKMRSRWSNSMSSWLWWRIAVERWKLRLRRRNKTKRNQLCKLSSNFTPNKILRSYSNNWRKLNWRSSRRRQGSSSRSRSRTRTWNRFRLNFKACKLRSRNATVSTAWTNSKLKSCVGNCLNDCWSQLIRSTSNSFSCRHKYPKRKLRRKSQQPSSTSWLSRVSSSHAVMAAAKTTTWHWTTNRLAPHL